MSFNGAGADEEFIGHLLAGETSHDKFYDFNFAVRELDNLIDLFLTCKICGVLFENNFFAPGC